eukprot:3306064-Lingulodinium_polyedra.AAC.1
MARWCSRWSRPGAPAKTSPRVATAPPSTGSAGDGGGAPSWSRGLGPPPVPNDGSPATGRNGG